MTYKHTPAPWSINGHNLAQVIKIKEGADRNGREYRDGRHQEIIANVGEDGMPWDERAANTRLIAAAPVLLEAAIAVMQSEFAKKYHLIAPFKELEAAITKAREY